MVDFSKYDIEEGFVLPQGGALRYLQYIVEQTYEQAIQKGAYGIDSESAGAVFKDLVAMGQTITDKNWEWVRFEEHPMSASGINITEMVVKE